ncbi:MAG: hypothetical protein H6983_23220 [Ectothiorhodospiraceae bacterium]|nr:hypothetical protein [Ectothiorhodospiraceae bacterium]
MRSNPIRDLSGALGIAAMALGCGAAQATQFTITDLGAFGVEVVRAVNASGQVTGAVDHPPTASRRGFLGDASGVIDQWVLPTGTDSDGWDINASGQVVGWSSLVVPGGGIERHAVLRAGGTVTDLGTLGGSSSFAISINDAGTIAGYSTIACATPPFCDQHAFVGSVGGLTDLGTLGGATSRAFAINASGQVVGEAALASGTESHAFLWDAAGGMVDLGTLGGARSTAWAINDAGQVAGFSRLAEGTFNRAFVGDVSGLTDIGTLGGAASAALGINNLGQVVGNSRLTGDVVTHAFLWDATGGMQDLNGLVSDLTGWDRLVSADAIGDGGHIVGTGVDASGATRPFLLTPVLDTGGPTLPAFGDGTLETGWTIGASEGTAVVGPSPVAGDDGTVVTLTTGSPISIVHDVDTPAVPFTLTFEYLFGTTTGVLEILLGSVVLDTITAPASLLADFQLHAIAVSDPSLLGRSALDLEFYFDGVTNSVVHLDAIALVAPASVPEPLTALLVLGGLLGAGGARRARRGR